MPENKIHRWFTNRRYRVDGGDIHKWMDEPAQRFGIEHRQYRHDPLMWIPEPFERKYGLDLARAIVRSHIWLDNNWNRYKEKQTWVN